MSDKPTQNHHILMGDVTGSSRLNSSDVAYTVTQATKIANGQMKDKILSPLTVTLGDEFQGVIASATDTLKTILMLRNRIYEHKLPDLHFSWVYGPIETAINPEIAHGMLGPALTKARKNLTRKDRMRPQVQVDLGDNNFSTILNNTLLAMMDISGRWKSKDALLISDFLHGIEVKNIAARHDRDTSSIYRRRETLMIDAYMALADAALAAAGQFDMETGHT